ncbi:VOC family protein [Alcaligenaceae bacterium]|nr:VOC family protein [Alcaligenaceae bacterium]
MLKTIDRILVAVDNLDNAETNYKNVLGASTVDDYESTYLNAKVRVMAIGSSWVELCQATGPGITEDRLQKNGEGLLFGGASTATLNQFVEHLNTKGIKHTFADQRIYIGGDLLYGMPLVVSPPHPAYPATEPTSIEFVYELTVVLKSSWREVAGHYTDLFGLDADKRVGITFPRFGYEGSLLMFNDEHLDRIELSEAHDPAYPMGRFSAKQGDGLYMCYVQTNDLADVISRLDTHKCRWTRRTDTPVEQDGLWIHPSALNGVLIGVSRTSLAWGWSGKPERVQPLD